MKSEKHNIPAQAQTHKTVLHLIDIKLNYSQQPTEQKNFKIAKT